MKIQKIQSACSFRSKNNPLKPFVINTKQGRLFVQEASVEELKNEKFLRKIVHFFIKNFASSTKDPYWLKFNQFENRGEMIDSYIDYLRPKIRKDDGNMSLLMAKDRFGRLCGACWSYGYQQIPEAVDTTCYIEALAVDDKYRGCHLGDRLLTKTMDLNKKTFTDVFLKGEMFATGFYRNMGFEIMSEALPNQKDVVKILASQGEGYPDYIRFFTKPLQVSKQRWFEVVSDRLKS